MPTFAYEALNAAGKPQKGVVEAASSEEAIQRIKGQGYFPTAVREQKVKVILHLPDSKTMEVTTDSTGTYFFKAVGPGKFYITAEKCIKGRCANGECYLDKKFVIAVSKSDMLDDELKDAIQKELPGDIPNIFVSSIARQGLVQLKDLLWNALN